MRILIIQPWIRGGGAELLSIELAAALDAVGDEVTIAALFVAPDGLPPAVASRRYRLPPRWLARRFALSRVLTLTLGPLVLLALVVRAARRADVLNPHNLPAPLVAAIAGPLTGRPVVWTCNEVPAALPADEARSVGRIEALAWRAGAIGGRVAARVPRDILVLSEKTRAAVRQAYGRDAVVVRPGIDLVGFAAEHLGGQGRLALLYVAKLHPQKDPLLAVRILATIRARGLDASLRVVGDGPLAAETTALAASLGVADHVVIEHGLDRATLVDRYRRADVLLVTAGGHQSWGLTPFEALAAGTPAVLSAEAGAAEVLGPADAALVVPRTADAFAAAAVRLGADRGLAARLVTNGAQLAASLTWPRYAATCREAYARAAAAPIMARPVAAWLLLVVALALFAMQVAAQFGRVPVVWPDETLFAQPALLLLREGRLGTPLLAGAAAGVADRSYWFPEGYSLLLAGAFALAGGTVEVMRALSVASAAGLLAATYALARRFGGGPGVAAGAVALLAVDPVFVRAALIGRPDGIALAFIVLSLVLGLAGPRRAFAAGLCAAIATFLHPYGAIAVLVLLARMAADRRRPALFAFGGLVLPVLPWIAYVLQDPAAFVDQLALTFARHDRPWSLVKVLGGIVEQYGGGWSWFVPLAWTLGAIGLAAGTRHDRRVLPLLGAFVLLSLTTWSIQLWHPLYALPVMYVGIARLVALLARLHLRQTFPVVATTVIIAGLLLADATALSYRTQVAVGARPAAYGEWAAAIARDLPARSRVLLGGVPDPSFGLFGRDLVLVALQDEPRSYAYFRTHLADEIDYVVFSGSPPTGMEALIRGRVTLERVVQVSTGQDLRPCADWLPCAPFEATIWRVIR